MMKLFLTQQSTAESITQQSTAEAIAVTADPAKEIVFLGMTAPELVALGTGIAVGGALCYVGYKYYKSKLNNNINIFDNKKELKSFKELLLKQEQIDILDKIILKKWFDTNHVEIDDAKLMIAFPSDEVIKAMGYNYDKDDLEEKKEKAIIQSIYNSKNGTVYKMRYITYKRIESDLEAKLLENGGLVILEE